MDTTHESKDAGVAAVAEKRDADYVFYELTRSICPDCRRVIDGHILVRDLLRLLSTATPRPMFR